jgi:hypothetical protein
MFCGHSSSKISGREWPSRHETSNRFRSSPGVRVTASPEPPLGRSWPPSAGAFRCCGGSTDSRTIDLHWRPRVAFPLKTNVAFGSRGRSFLFLALGGFAGSGLQGPFDLRIPENGLIALNVPLDPTRIGSNSTRTTHPYYLRRWNELLGLIGIPGTVTNPYWDRTKGEMVRDCLMPDALRELIPLSVSCAHPSIKRFAKDNKNHCGTCVPCIIRRAAIEAALGAGNDPTRYRCEDLTAQRLSAKGKDGKQVRGFQYALDRLAREPGLSRIAVHKPGPLREDVANLDGLIGVYERGMMEVERLLHGVRTT